MASVGTPISSSLSVTSNAWHVRKSCSVTRWPTSRISPFERSTLSASASWNNRSSPWRSRPPLEVLGEQLAEVSWTVSLAPVPARTRADGETALFRMACRTTAPPSEFPTRTSASVSVATALTSLDVRCERLRSGVCIDVRARVVSAGGRLQRPGGAGPPGPYWCAHARCVALLPWT